MEPEQKGFKAQLPVLVKIDTLKHTTTNYKLQTI